MLSEHKVTGVDFSYSIPDVIWDRIITLLRSPSILRRKKKKTGRPRMDDRKEGYECYILHPTHRLSVEYPT